MGITLASLLAIPKAHAVGYGVILGVGGVSIGAAKLSNHLEKKEGNKNAARINLFMKVFLMSATFGIFIWFMLNMPFIALLG